MKNDVCVISTEKEFVKNCGKCGNKFSNQSKKLRHEKYAVCANPNEAVVCQICGEIFDNIKHYTVHERNLHAEKTYCKDCGIMFPARETSNHMKSAQHNKRFKTKPLNTLSRSQRYHVAKKMVNTYNVSTNEGEQKVRRLSWESLKKINPAVKGPKDKLESLDEEDASEIMTELKLSEIKMLEFLKMLSNKFGRSAVNINMSKKISNSKLRSQKMFTGKEETSLLGDISGTKEELKEELGSAV